MIQDIHHVEQSKSNSVMQHLSINKIRCWIQGLLSS